MATNALTELDAVNIILAAVSQAPVSNLSSPLTGTVALAKNILDEVRRDVLFDGWMFNSDFEKPYTPDSITGEVILPENILRVDGSDGKHTSLDLTYREGKLYDLGERTYNLSGQETVYLDVVYHQEFTAIPDIARNYIAKRAARVMVDRTFNEPGLSSMFRQEEFEALVRLRRHEGLTGDYNMLTGSNYVARSLARRSPFWR